MDAFHRISFDLQEKIIGVSEKKRDRILKKIEEIGEGIRQLIPVTNNDLEIKKGANKIKVLDNNDFIGLVSKDCYLDNKKIGFYGYEELNGTAILKFMYSSNKKVSTYLSKDCENKILEQADINRDQYLSFVYKSNEYIFNKQEISLNKYKYIGSSIFLNFIKELLNKNIKNLLIKSFISSVGFYEKVLNFLKREGLILDYIINNSSNSMEKNIEVILNNTYIAEALGNNLNKIEEK